MLPRNEEITSMPETQSSNYRVVKIRVIGGLRSRTPSSVRIMDIQGFNPYNKRTVVYDVKSS
jgi:hypothetical protein